MADTLTWKVDGMTCGGCAATVERVALGMAGVTRARTRHDLGQVEFEVAPDVDLAELRRRIERAGYDVAAL
jgi:copper chaperone CopZ